MLFSFPGRYTTSAFYFRCFTLLRKHLRLFLASGPMYFVEDVLMCFFAKNYSEDQIHAEITEMPSTCSTIVAQETKCNE